MRQRPFRDTSEFGVTGAWSVGELGFDEDLFNAGRTFVKGMVEFGHVFDGYAMRDDPARRTISIPS